MDKKAEKHTYTYTGPVMKFDICIAHEWTAQTFAASEAKARSNLVYRFKTENGLLPSAKISLPGRISLI